MPQHRVFAPIRQNLPLGVELYLWDLTETEEELIALLPDSSLLECPPYTTFKSVKRRREWLAVRVLLHQVRKEQLSICYEESGRPYLNPSIASFSISHTDGCVAIALSPSPVGIDVERIGPRAYKVRDHFLQSDELDLETNENPELMATFAWSAKESVYKLIDRKEAELKSDIFLQSSNSDFGQLVFDATVTHEQRNISVNCFLCDQSVLTVAVWK